MSIIYDALKKAQKTINIGSKVQTDTKDMHSKSNPKLYLLYVLMVCLGLFIGNIIFSFLTHSKTASKGPAKPSPPSIAKKLEVKPQPVVQKTEEVQPNPQEVSSISRYKKETQGSLVLNGIFFSQDQGYALINNQIVKVGDVVDGATVKRITQDEVELEVSGTAVTLSTRIR